MADKDEVIQSLIAAAKSAEAPEELESLQVDETLLMNAQVAFGDWETALAAGLMEAVRGRSKPTRPKQSEVERRVGDAFEHPIYVGTHDGKFFSFHGPDLPVDDDPQDLDEEELTGGIQALHYVGDSDAVFLFSSNGRYFGVDRRMIPTWDRRDQPRSIRDILFLEGGESIRAMIPRRQMATGRIIHITAGGKGKATDAADFGMELDRSGQEAFLVKEGDVPVAVMGGPTDNTVFCASAMGQGIHFEADDLRSMGRKAVGVNVMKLNGDDDRIVDAFLGRHVRQLAVVTEEGYAKRVDFSEFRTQGRAGQGMQLARLNSGDKIAGAVPCNPAEDLALITNTGRVWRIAATELLLMGRPAKGNQVVDLPDGVRIVGVEALPCGG